MCSGSGERGSWTSGEIFDEINSLLDRLSSEDLTAVPSAAMADDQLTLQRIVSRVQAEFLRRLRRFDSGQGYANTLALSAKAWLRWKCNLTPEAASDQVEVARELDSLPQTTKAFADGDISYRHVALIAHTAAEPGGVLGDANEEHDRRYLYLSQTLDGVFYLNGRFDPEAGAVVRTALDSVMKPPAADDDRTPKQRRADAWVDLARRQLDGGQLPEVGGQKPHLMVTLDMSTLTKEPGSRAAELEWASPIPAETARRLACDCTITPILCGPESHQVEVAGSSRVIPPAMKRALIARDKHCRFPGCDMPPAWTDGHHIKHWANGGPHALWNLLLLCLRHHRLFHEGGWKLQQAEGGVVAIPP